MVPRRVAHSSLDGKVVIGENFSVNRTKGTDAPGGILENALEFNSNFPIYAENGEFAQALGAYSERENPLSLIYNNKDNEYTQWRMFGDAHISVTPFHKRNSVSSPILLQTVR